MPQHIALLLIALMVSAAIMVRHWKQVLTAFLVLTIGLTGVGLYEVINSIR